MARTVTLPTLHSDQLRALRTNGPSERQVAHDAGFSRVKSGRFKAIRCGRRYGKTKLDTTVACNHSTKGRAIGWFAPDYKKLSEAYEEAKLVLKPVTVRASKTDGVISTTSGGRIDFWTLDDENAGRSRFYHGVIIDEGAFTKTPQMLGTWDKAIKPTLLDYNGWALVTSNTNGVDPENFLYAICNDPKWGFAEYHAPSISNPLLPIRRPGESDADHWERRVAAFKEIEEGVHPLVFKQEYLAEFVDWSGVAFFDLAKMLVLGEPVGYPARCDGVYAVIDSATKTGTDNDGTAVTYFARTSVGYFPLVVLDWDVVQIEGALLETWVPTVLARLEELAGVCNARHGNLGLWIENKASGEILLQQMMKRSAKVRPIDGRLTALGKDERAISVSGYHFRGEVKVTDVAYHKTVKFKDSTRNHFISQVTGFRIGDKDAAKRADDLLDTYTYGISLGLGNGEGY